MANKGSRKSLLQSYYNDFLNFQSYINQFDLSNVIDFLNSAQSDIDKGACTFGEENFDNGKINDILSKVNTSSESINILKSEVASEIARLLSEINSCKD